MKVIASASAPGKVVLCGEYAVLENFPCVVLAVNRRVRVSLKTAEKPGFWISSPGYRDSPERVVCADQFVVDPRQVHYHMLLRTLNRLNFLPLIRQKLKTTKALELEVDSRALFHGGQKLGLGSSAALTSAIAALLSGCFDPDSSNQLTLGEQWLNLHRVHSEIQGKVGSGVDIAASLAGGVIHFRKNNDASQAARLAPFVLPKGLAMAFVWMGQSASTPAYLNKMKVWQEKNLQSYASFMRDMGRALTQINLNNTTSEILDIANEFTRSLYNFDQASNLGVFAGGHAELYQRAKNYPRLVFKPCGAGGGDLGVVLSDEVSTLNAYIADLREKGIVQINLAIDPQGGLAETMALN